MLVYVIQRIITTLGVLLGVITVVFLLLHVIPGDPAETMLAGSGASEAQIAQTREQLGLNDPLPVQYGRYVLNTLRGDLGRSLFSDRAVAVAIAEQLPSTLQLAAAALLVAVILGFGLGLLAALRADTWIDHVVMGVAVLGVSVPVFWSGLVLILVFSVGLNWLPATGVGGWQHLVMPAIVLGLVGAGPIARLVRASLISALRADYISMARAKGLPSSAVIGGHALRNAIIPVIALVGLQAGFLLGGTVVTEAVFARPGLGRLVVEAILSKDLPVVRGVVLLTATTYVVINLVVDLATLALDPRQRQ
jgi:ABC-type dipeptide/oligopeptide/nickel transport system permease component